MRAVPNEIANDDLLDWNPDAPNENPESTSGGLVIVDVSRAVSLKTPQHRLFIHKHCCKALRRECHSILAGDCRVLCPKIAYQTRQIRGAKAMMQLSFRK